MTGYGILLTFDSRVLYARATLVRRMSPARAKVSSHPHSSRFKYQTRTERGKEKDGARLMPVPINAPYQWRLQISLCCPFPARSALKRSKPIIVASVHRDARLFKVSFVCISIRKCIRKEIRRDPCAGCGHGDNKNAYFSWLCII